MVRGQSGGVTVNPKPVAPTDYMDALLWDLDPVV